MGIPYEPNSDVVLPEPHNFLAFESRSFGRIVWSCSCGSQGATRFVTQVDVRADHHAHKVSMEENDA
jgi:hypothetical protein